MIRTGLTLLAGVTAATLLIESKATPYWKLMGSMAIFSTTIAVLPKKKQPELPPEQKAELKQWADEIRKSQLRPYYVARYGYSPF